ncbi:MAG: sugar phosphate isomerase/epimerase [Chloroflexota bacterium]
MRLTVTSYSFEAIPLEGALAVVKSMGFKGTDIAGFHNRGKASLEPDAVGQNPQHYADYLKRLMDTYELLVFDYFVQFGSSTDERALTDPNPAVVEQNIQSIKGIAQFCKTLAIPSVTVLPGVDDPSRTLEQNLELAGKGLKRYVEICGEYGVTVCFEPHMGSVVAKPELALNLIERAPGVKLALDYTHFVLQYIPLERIHPLLPHAGNFHIRPARPGKLQTRWIENTIDYFDIINRLKALKYEHCMAIEYVCQDWYDGFQLDTLSETMIAKAALEPHVPV